jgi:hypothetical protein
MIAERLGGKAALVGDVRVMPTGCSPMVMLTAWIVER